MTRNVTSAFRRTAESSFSDEVDLCFLTISHPTLSEPIRVVWDTKDFIYGGYTWTGFPFDLEILSDDEQPPQARLVIQNVDPRIGDTIRALTSPPRLKIELLSSADFDLTVDPRVESAPIGGNTVLLAHFDGVDGATTTTDSGPNSHTITFAGGVEIDTAQSKFGGSSVLVPSGSWTTDSSADFTWGTGDFSIDFWYRTADVTAQQNIIGWHANNVIYKPAGSSALIYYNSANVIITSTAIVNNTWYHGELSRSSGSTKLFINGTQEGSTYADSNNYTGTVIKSPSDTGSGWWLDEVRVLKGEAAHTANFTPETAAYGAGNATAIYSADRLFLTNVTVDVMAVSGTIVGWDYLQRVWPGPRAMESSFPGLFR
jgi:Domain of unknown function (DUF1833)